MSSLPALHGLNVSIPSQDARQYFEFVGASPFDTCHTEDCCNNPIITKALTSCWAASSTDFNYGPQRKSESSEDYCVFAPACLV